MPLLSSSTLTLATSFLFFLGFFSKLSKLNALLLGFVLALGVALGLPLGSAIGLAVWLGLALGWGYS